MVSDLLLLQRYAQSRDAEAFAELNRRYAGLVFGVCFRILHNAADAEDVAQDCFFELAHNAGSITTSLPGWLHAMARSRAIDAVRRNQTRQKYEQQAYAPDDAGREITWAEIAPYIDDALETLPEELRLPVILHYLQGMAQKDIAIRCGVSNATISRRMEQSIAALRDRLRELGVVASVVILAGLLQEHGAVAAPATLLAALGKIAISGVGGTTVATATGSTIALGAKVIAGIVLTAALLTTGILAVREISILCHPTVVVQSARGITDSPAHPSDITTTLNNGVVDIGDIVSFAGQQKRFTVLISLAQIPAEYRQGFTLYGGCNNIQVDGVVYDRKRELYSLYGTFTLNDDEASGMNGYFTSWSSCFYIANKAHPAVEFAKFTVHTKPPFLLATGGGDLTVAPDNPWTSISIECNRTTPFADAHPQLAQVSPNLDARLRDDGSGCYLEVRRKPSMPTQVARLRIGFVALATPNKRYYNSCSFTLRTNAPSWYSSSLKLSRKGAKFDENENRLLLAQPVPPLREVAFTVTPPDIRITPTRIEGKYCYINMSITTPWPEHRKYFIFQQAGKAKPTGATLVEVVRQDGA